MFDTFFSFLHLFHFPTPPMLLRLLRPWNQVTRTHSHPSLNCHVANRAPDRTEESLSCFVWSASLYQRGRELCVCTRFGLKDGDFRDSEDAQKSNALPSVLCFFGVIGNSEGFRAVKAILPEEKGCSSWSIIRLVSPLSLHPENLGIQGGCLPFLAQVSSSCNYSPSIKRLGLLSPSLFVSQHISMRTPT